MFRKIISNKTQEIDEQYVLEQVKEVIHFDPPIQIRSKKNQNSRFTVIKALTLGGAMKGSMVKAMAQSHKLIGIKLMHEGKDFFVASIFFNKYLENELDEKERDVVKYWAKLKNSNHVQHLLRYGGAIISEE